MRVERAKLYMSHHRNIAFETLSACCTQPCFVLFLVSVLLFWLMFFREALRPETSAKTPLSRAPDVAAAWRFSSVCCLDT